MFSRLQERKQARSWNAGLRSPLPNSPRYPAGEMHFEVWMVLAVPSFHVMQSVTSRFETSQYRDFSQFFESIGLSLENFGLEKKSRYRSRKY